MFVGANVEGGSPVGLRDGCIVGTDVVGASEGRLVGAWLGVAIQGPQYPTHDKPRVSPSEESHSMCWNIILLTQIQQSWHILDDDT